MAEHTLPTRSKKGSITDARGRKVTQLDPVAMRLLARHDTIPAEPLRKITEELDPGEVRKRWRGLIQGVVAAIVFIILISLYLRFISRSGIGRWRDPVMLSIAAGYVLIPPILVYFRFSKIRRSRRDRICRVMLAHLRCPHCGYDLTGLPIDETDCTTVCPECGCVWHRAHQHDGVSHSDDSSHAI